LRRDLSKTEKTSRRLLKYTKEGYIISLNRKKVTMTRIGIIYDTDREEATIRVVDWMKETLGQKGLEVKSGKPGEFDNLDYDGFIIGSAIYGFAVRQKKLLRLLEENKEQLRGKSIAIFVVCGAPKLSWLYKRGITKRLPQQPVAQAAFKGYKDEKGREEFIMTQKPKVIEWASGTAAKLPHS
jgi:menaquinone-dependent protoporphyrinogen IX oxidase